MAATKSAFNNCWQRKPYLCAWFLLDLSTMFSNNLLYKKWSTFSKLYLPVAITRGEHDAFNVLLFQKGRLPNAVTFSVAFPLPKIANYWMGYHPIKLVNEESLMLLLCCIFEKIFFDEIFCYNFAHDRSSHRRCSVRKGVLRNFEKFIGKHLVFSCEFCEISKNTFYTEHLWMTGSIMN